MPSSLMTDGEIVEVPDESLLEHLQKNRDLIVIQKGLRKRKKHK